MRAPRVPRSPCLASSACSAHFAAAAPAEFRPEFLTKDPRKLGAARALLANRAAALVPSSNEPNEAQPLTALPESRAHDSARSYRSELFRHRPQCAADYAQCVTRVLSEFRLLHPMIRSSEAERRGNAKPWIFKGAASENSVKACSGTGDAITRKRDAAV